MIQTMKWGSVTAVLTTLLTILTACTTATQSGQSIEPTSRPLDEPTSQSTPEPERPSLDLPDLGEAPEIRNDVWINTDEPVTLAASQGKVVLLEFWTFG